MPSLHGRVTAIESKTSPKGKTYYRVQVGGQWLSTWDEPECSNGDEITYNIVQNGNFKNISDIRKVEGAVGTVLGTAVPLASPTRNFDTDREARILRQNAFTSASSLVGALVQAQGPKGNWDLRKMFEGSVKLAQEIFQINMYGYPDPKDKAPSEGAPTKEAGADDLFKY